MSISAIMEKLGHSGRRIDMLKIDIEGADWVALSDVFRDISKGHMRVDQIQVELHGSDIATINNLFELADDAKMRVMHKERNGWGCDGKHCLEYSFVSEHFLRKHHKYILCNGMGEEESERNTKQETRLF